LLTTERPPLTSPRNRHVYDVDLEREAEAMLARE
jgi:hypothetical protein